MSRRQRGSRRAPYRTPGNAESAPWSGVHPSEDAPGSSLREQLERASVPARALLPVRFFFGATFVYAGMDKLIDPAFFDSSSPASIYGQLAAFVHVSPLAPLVRIAEPFALPLGLLIALGEIAIGLGAITGLAYRAAATAGAILSLLFWLTASWTTHPYYYGPDLPYAFGWMALALAGHADLLVHRSVLELGAWITDDWPGTLRSGAGYHLRGRTAVVEASPLRRQVLQAGALGAFAVTVASLAVPLRILRPASSDGQVGLAGDTGGPGAGTGGDGSGAGIGTGDGSQGLGSEGSAALGGQPSPTPVVGTGSGAGSGLTVASLSTVDQRGAARIRIPNDAPAPYPAGDPGIIVKLANGKYVAYDATCTHQGCRVGWDAQDGVLLCPCHGAAFDPSNHGAVLGGPTNQPLLELQIVVDKQAGTISLKA